MAGYSLGADFIASTTLEVIPCGNRFTCREGIDFCTAEMEGKPFAAKFQDE